MKYTKDELIELIKSEVVPAVGCTEPVAVAFATAKAKETLGCIPEHIEIRLSRNVLKNAMAVGIPGTGMVGLPIAAALGAVTGKSAYHLEVLKDVNAQAVTEAKRMVDEKRVSILLDRDTKDKLYIECRCSAGDESSRVVIRRRHTNITLVEHNGRIRFERVDEDLCENENNGCHKELSLREVYDFALCTPVEELRFILDSEKLNMQASAEALKGSYGLNIGKTLHTKVTQGLLSDDVCNRMLYSTAAAVDARMGGATFKVMSNSGSGNQGITATVPVSVFASGMNKPEDERIRALALSHLTVIYIKMTLGRLAALCGCVVASIGSSAAMVYLMGGGYEQVTYAVKNMIANITGMLCDGAKAGCSLKMTTGTRVAYYSAIMAMDNIVVDDTDGIVDKDVDKTIRNMAEIGSEGMHETDKMILDIMTSKDKE